MRSLEAEESSTDADTLLFQLAACQQYAAGGAGREYTPEDLAGEACGCRRAPAKGRGQAGRAAQRPRECLAQPPAAGRPTCPCSRPSSTYTLLSPAPRAVLGKSSRRLLAFTVQRKWVAATRTLLAAVAADQPAAEAMAAVDVMCVGTTGMPLLQLAVRSQRLELVREVLDWGEDRGEPWRGGASCGVGGGGARGARQAAGAGAGPAEAVPSPARPPSSADPLPALPRAAHTRRLCVPVHHARPPRPDRPAPGRPGARRRRHRGAAV